MKLLKEGRFESFKMLMEYDNLSFEKAANIFKLSEEVRASVHESGQTLFLQLYYFLLEFTNNYRYNNYKGLVKIIYKGNEWKYKGRIEKYIKKLMK